MSVLQLINQLTHDEDKRQDLWVAYLEGTPSDSLHDIVPIIDLSQKIQDQYGASIHRLMSDPINQDFIDYLAPIEQIIVCLLMLGCDLGTISRYNSISEVKICQIMVSLKESNAWDILYGLEEKLQ